MDIHRIGKSLQIDATVTESFTNLEIKATTLISLNLQPIKIKKLFTPKIIKPGLLYTAYVNKCTGFDNFNDLFFDFS